MKLRNKKTGEVFDALIREKGGGGEYSLTVCDIKAYEKSKSSLDATHFVLDEYDTLAELNEEWEDYEPKEPLIKNEKIRRAVKAWAEACNLKHVTYKQASNEFYDADTRGAFAIRFTLIPVEVYLEDGEHYTIAELCGEEEE